MGSLLALLGALKDATFDLEVHVREFKGNWALLMTLTVLAVAVLALLFRALERWL